MFVLDGHRNVGEKGIVLILYIHVFASCESNLRPVSSVNTAMMTCLLTS